MEAAFSVYEACNVCIQSFLLIDRTCRVVTASGIHDFELIVRM